MESEKVTLGIGKGTPGPGRKKGVPNRQTMAAKDAIALAAEGLGGTSRLIEWAKEDPLNERAFWTSIYPKLLPLTVNGNMTIRTLAQELSELNDASAKSGS
jgi:hypothetical protein